MVWKLNLQGHRWRRGCHWRPPGVHARNNIRTRRGSDQSLGEPASQEGARPIVHSAYSPQIPAPLASHPVPGLLSTPGWLRAGSSFPHGRKPTPRWCMCLLAFLATKGHLCGPTACVVSCVPSWGRVCSSQEESPCAVGRGWRGRGPPAVA